MVAGSLLFGLVAAAVANAQTIATSSASSVAASTTVSQSMPPSATQAFNPALVNSTVKFSWCLAQLNNCPQICGGSASTNFCDQDQLTYNCVCPNGTVPDCTVFANTLPFFICQQTFIQCIANNPNDAEAQSNCTKNEQCGTRNATAEAIAATSAQSGPSSTGGSSASGSATGASSSPSASSSGNAAVANVHQLSTGAFAALLMALFKLVV